MLDVDEQDDEVDVRKTESYSKVNVKRYATASKATGRRALASHPSARPKTWNSEFKGLHRPTDGG